MESKSRAAPRRQFHPAVMVSLSEALERFDPLHDLGSLRHATGSAPASEGVLLEYVQYLRGSSSYDDIVLLAGRNTVRTINPRLPAFTRLLTLKQRIRLMAGQLLPAVLGSSQFGTAAIGSVILLELSGSIFARASWGDRPCCGYYCGVLKELAAFCGANAASSAEVRCQGADSYARSCLLHLEL